MEFPGAVHHQASRGDVQSPVFPDDIDRKIFRAVLGLPLRRFNVIRQACCLMADHVHVLIETPDSNL